MEIEREIVVPSEAVGRVIGAKGAKIATLRTTPGITVCALEKTALNAHTLRLSGTEEAVGAVTKEVTELMAIARRQLENSVREHSWTLTPDGRMRTPREVHQTGGKAPTPHTTGVGRNHYAARMQGKRFEKEAERADQLRRESGRDEGTSGSSHDRDRDRDGRKGSKSGRDYRY
jgi:hypothetical protein